jgi:mRNA interferase MazF
MLISSRGKMVFKWKIFSANLNPVTGSELKGIRPVLIISDDDYSSAMPVVTVLPITSLKPGRKVYPNEVLLVKEEKVKTGLSSDSIILAHQIRTISKKRLRDFLGFIDNEKTQSEVEDALRIHLNL